MNRFRQDKGEEKKSWEERPKPLRQFNHDGSQKTGSVGAPEVGGRTKLFPFWLLAVFAIVVFLTSGTFLFLYLSGQSEKTETQVEASTVLSARTEMGASELFEAYLKAVGGRDALQQIRSVRYEGEVVFASSGKDFQMYLLMPDKGMLVTSPGEAASQKLMLNGDAAWQVVDLPDGKRKVVPLEEDETRALRWSMRVHNTFRELAMEGRAAEVSVREIEYLGKPCYEVSKEAPDGSDFLAVLEKETLYLLKTVETVSRGEEKDKFTVLYDDHRMVSGVVEPYNTKLYRNGSLDNEVVIDSIRINSGVMSSLFEIPEEILN